MKLKLKELAVFAVLGAFMFISKQVMEALPNIHLLGTLIVAYTVVFRHKALYPIYVFVFLQGLLSGFATWWIPYIYIWAVLWGATMLLPKGMKPAVAAVVYPIVSALHGLLYGTLYAPAQALLFGLDFEGMITWIIAGIPADVTHCLGNLVCGLLIIPIISALKAAQKRL